MFPVTKPRQYVNRKARKSNVSGETSLKTGYLLDLDADATMKVCRVCLVMNVKMYLISEHKLSVMYKQVSGVEISPEDKLPKMLCWECVARLSSADKFIKKTLKTHQILVDKINSRAFVTIGDIKSIDKAEYQLTSTLGFKVFNDNDSNFYSINESEHYNKYEACDSEFYDYDVEIKKEEELMFNTEINVSNEEYPIKREYLDATEEEIVADEQAKAESIRNVKDEIKYHAIEIVKQEYMSDEEVAIDNDSNVRIQFSRDDQLFSDNETVCLPPIKQETDFVEAITLNTDTIKEEKYIENCELGDTSSIAGFSTSINYRNINFLQNYPEFSKELFICDVCGEHFYVKSNLVRHIKKHSLSTLYKCTYCSYESCHKRYLTKHIMRMHTKKDAIYSCKYCSYQTHFKKTLNVHINCKHTKRVSYNCDYCSYVAYNKDTLKRHVNIKHIKNKVFHCSYCSFETDRKDTITKHIHNKHTKSVSFNCDTCNYGTHNKHNLIAHINAKHTKDIVFNCSYCSFQTYRRQSLSKHINSLHTKTNSFDCSHCSFKAYDKYTLDEHTNVKHTKQNIYYCSYCSFKTYNKGSLKSHINIKHTKNISFKCSFCSYEAYDKRTLGAHVNAKHTKRQVFKCSHCSYKAYTKINLSNHVNAIHTKTDVFYCSSCDFKAFQKFNLTAHINSQHTKNISYDCSLCNYSTYDKRNLSRHVNSKHPKTDV